MTAGHSNRSAAGSTSLTAILTLRCAVAQFSDDIQAQFIPVVNSPYDDGSIIITQTVDQVQPLSDVCMFTRAQVTELR